MTASVDPRALSALLVARGVRFATGVPCSILEPLQRALEDDARVSYVPAAVEGEAVALAAGAWLAGGMGALLLQNSGLGNAINPLSSLALPYRIPMLLVISHRGQPGVPDAEHHLPMGEATRALLALFGIPYRVLDVERDAVADLDWALNLAASERTPVALLVPRGALGKVGARAQAVSSVPERAIHTPLCFGQVGASLPSRQAVLNAWCEHFAAARCVSTTGFMSRELAGLGHFERHFPMQGSMGFASAIALGMSLARPQRPVCVLDGDGALWMRLGSLATIGSQAPKHFVHVVVDNGSYASTGAQPNVSATLDFARVALACGYAGAGDVVAEDGLAAGFAWAAARASEGPVLVRVRTAQDPPGAAERPGLGAAEIASRFRNAALAEHAP